MRSIIRNLNVPIFSLVPNKIGVSLKGVNQLVWFSTTNVRLSSAGPVNLAYSSYESTSSDNDANPVIIMHGLFGMKQNWRSISKVLHNKTNPPRKIIAVDARNHGESPHSAQHTYESMAHDLVEFLKMHNIKKCSVIGHSMGGRAMMALALIHPELVEKAIIIDISPISSDNDKKTFTHEFLFKAMKDIHVPNTLTPMQGRQYAEDQLKKVVPDKTTRDFLLMNLIKDSNGNFGWRVNLDALITNYKDIVNFPKNLTTLQYDGPVLFIKGSRSDYVNNKDIPAIQKMFPKLIFKELDSGHLVHFENPHEFLNVLVPFLNKPV